MALVDDLTALRDRALADLSAAYDYYNDTTVAWRIVHKVVAAGGTLRIRNSVTGTSTIGE